MWKRKVVGTANQTGMDAQWTLAQQETAKLATTSLVAAERDPLADQLKTWWSMELNASNCSVSGKSKDDDKVLEILNATT